MTQAPYLPVSEKNCQFIFGYNFVKCWHIRRAVKCCCSRNKERGVCGGGLPIPSKIFYSKKYASVVVFVYISIPRSSHVSLKILNLAALTFFSGGPLDIMELMPVNIKNKYSRNNVKRQHYLHDVTSYFVRYNVSEVYRPQYYATSGKIYW